MEILKPRPIVMSYFAIYITPEYPSLVTSVSICLIIYEIVSIDELCNIEFNIVYIIILSMVQIL
jgi:hypothetical protein